MESNLLALVSNNFLVAALVSVIIVITASSLFIFRTKKPSAGTTNTLKSQEKRNKTNNSKQRKTTQPTRNENVNAKPQTANNKEPKKTVSVHIEKKATTPVLAAAIKITKNAPAVQPNTIKSNAGKQKQVAPPVKVIKIKKNQVPAVERDSEFGEWTTVLNKKQKKQTNNDPLIEAVAAVSKGHTLKLSKSQKTDKKVKVDKKPKIRLSHTETNLKQHVDSQVTTSSKTFETVSAPLPAPTPAFDVKTVIGSTAEAQSISNTATSCPAEAQSTANIASIATAEPPSISNMVFDEMGDAAWIETKPQKKSKRRALRE